jgi:hypothetical protein
MDKPLTTPSMTEQDRNISQVIAEEHSRWCGSEAPATGSSDPA